MASHDWRAIARRLRTRGEALRAAIKRRDRVGQRVVRLVVRHVLLARKEPHERPAALRRVIAHGAAEHRVARLEGVQDRALRDFARDVERDLAVDARERSQVLR